MLKSALLALPMAVLAAGMAVAADPIVKQVEIHANIPSSSFYFEPEGSWLDKPQVMNWNPHLDTLSDVTGRFNAKSTVGDITAKVDAPTQLASGANAIDLEVSLAGKALSTTPVVVVAAADAAVGKLVDFKVVAKKPASGGYLPGDYQGIVNLHIETAAAP